MSTTLFRQLSKKWQPHDYQRKAVKFLIEHGAAALFLDPGLGKTSISLAAIKFLLKKGVIKKVLLVAPLRVCYSVWPAEIKKWKDFEHLKIAILHGPKKDQALKEDADIYIINPEGLDWLLKSEKTKTARGTKVKVDVRRFKRFGFDVLAIDELTKFKNTNTIRFKAMKQVLSTFHFRWGLTGSPAANGLMDLFGQCYMLDMGRSLGQYITHYRMTYFDQGYDGYSWNLKEGAELQIYKRIKPLALRMGEELLKDMPKLVTNNIWVDLPDKARDVYDEFEKELIIQLDDKTITAATAATASMKCRQIVSGAIYTDPEVTAMLKLRSNKSKREWIGIHDQKIEALNDLVEELQGEPILVGYDFKHDLWRLQEEYPDAPFIGGGVSPKQSKKYEDEWNDGQHPIMFVHPTSASLGLNLQECGHHIAWFTQTWNYEEYDQMIRRLRRQGNKSKRVFVHHILARNTVDEAVYGSILAKKAGQNALFNALKTLRNARRVPTS